jgi:hypothetical protein
MELHALGSPLAQVDVTATIAAGEVMVGLGAHQLGVGVLVDRHGVIAHAIEPIDHVLAPVAAGRAGRH